MAKEMERKSKETSGTGKAVCPECGRAFLPPSSRQRFCSVECGRAYYHHSGKRHREYAPGDTILREFTCRTCGKAVAVISKGDRRSVYCSQPCEKKWWRDATRHNNGVHRHGGNQGMSGGMSLGSLIRRERRDLG